MDCNPLAAIGQVLLKGFMQKTRLFVCLFLAITSLTAEMKILAFSGSTRAESYNQQLIQEAASLARQMGATVTVIQLKDYPMPFYDGDLESNEGMPKNARLLRKLMIESDAILIASPEYNHSISGVLKNALDWVSRGENGDASYDACKDKPIVIMSASPGKKGGINGLQHLRAVLKDIGGKVLDQQVTIPRAHQYFSEKTRPENPLLKKALQDLLAQNQ